ncbi:hypothetical protein [Rhodoferax sp.]|uniref:hypothetical protein n=1 Tax=Rhodoferax sp. TaxID=50421 RepID=UPI002840B6AD|nr:hypothetical protein [Rhodoferax sp.]MDR3368282.1 hypothetical protein [Rhodoferax sp.]
MTQPSIDRIQSVRPVAEQAAALSTGRVLPAVPINTSQQTDASAVVSPSVINMINTSDKSSSGEGVYSSVADPVRQNVEQAVPKDWTVKQPEPVKAENPAPEPLSKMLIDHVKSLWQASASAVQVQEQVKNQIDPTKVAATVAPGVISSEVYTYSPTKINKTEKTQT